MASYKLAVGTHDPLGIEAAGDAEAFTAAARLVRDRYGADLRDNPQEVATLLGPAGLMTRASERLDEFVARDGAGPAGAPGPIEPGQTNAPDCNGD